MNETNLGQWPFDSLQKQHKDSPLSPSSIPFFSSHQVVLLSFPHLPFPYIMAVSCSAFSRNFLQKKTLNGNHNTTLSMSYMTYLNRENVESMSPELRNHTAPFGSGGTTPDPFTATQMARDYLRERLYGNSKQGFVDMKPYPSQIIDRKSVV